MSDFEDLMEGVLDQLFSDGGPEVHVQVIEVNCGPPPKRLVKPVREFLASEINRHIRGDGTLGDAIDLPAPVHRDPFTMLSLSYMPAGSHRSFTGYGFAKRCKSDRPNRDYGAELAGQRAVKDLAQQLVEAGFRAETLDPPPVEVEEEVKEEIPF